MDNVHRVRMAVGNGLRPDVWKEFEERFQIPSIVEFYAATEGNSGFINLHNKFGSVGRCSPFLVKAPCCLSYCLCISYIIIFLRIQTSYIFSLYYYVLFLYQVLTLKRRTPDIEQNFLGISWLLSYAKKVNDHIMDVFSFITLIAESVVPYCVYKVRLWNGRSGSERRRVLHKDKTWYDLSIISDGLSGSGSFQLNLMVFLWYL